jgi:hypothetical protein
MARFDEIYEKYKKKQQNGTGFSGAVTSASGVGTVAGTSANGSGTKTSSYKATGRFADILSNYQKNGASFSGVDDSYVQSFFKDAEAFAQKAVKESKNMGWAMATDKAKNEERNQALTDLGNRAKAVKVYLTSNKKSIDPKAYEEYMRFLKNFENDKQSIYDTFLGNTNYYSQWDTQEEYDFHEAHSTPEKRREWYAGLEKRKKELEAQKEQEAAAWQETEANANSYDGFEYSEMEEAHWNKLKAIEEEINKIGTEMRQYERGGYNEKGQHYGSKQADDALALTMEKDFATLSQQRDQKNPTRQQLDEADSMNNSVNWDYDEMGVLRDAYGNAITTDETGKMVSTKAQEYAVKDKLGVYLSATDKEKEEYMGTIVNGTWGEIIGEGMEGSWDQLNDNEIGVYYYLLNKDGVAAAEKFLKEMTPELNRRAAEKARQAQLGMYNESGLGGKLLLNAATVPANLLGGITGLAEDTAHLIRGEETNPYSSAHSFNAFGNTIRSETAKELEELMPGVKIPLLNFTVGDLYQTIMSRVDSLAAMGIGGSLGGVLLATNAAANEMTRLYEQGASVKQMAWGAAAVGAAELVFETLSIENLKGIKDAKKRFGRIKSALVQGGIEASEEGLTEIANIISNSVVMGSESDWNKLVEANGGDELAAFLEKVRDVAKASFGGFLSGAPAGALASPGKQNQQQTQEKTNATVQAKPEAEAPAVGIDGVAWPTREDIDRMETGEMVQPKSKQPAAQTTTQPQQADKRLEWAKQDKEGLEAMIQKRQKADSIVMQRLNTEIDQLQAEYDGLKNKGTAKAKQLLEEIEGKKAGVERYAATGEEAVQKLQARLDKVNQEIEMLEWEPEAGEVAEEVTAVPDSQERIQRAEDIMGGKDSFLSKNAAALYEELSVLKKGVKASNRLGYILDHGYDWRSIKTALLNIRDNPNEVVNPNSQAEALIREVLGREYDDTVEDLSRPDEVTNQYAEKLWSIKTEIANNERLREEAMADYQAEIDRLQELYDSKANKTTKAANDILRRIERVRGMMNRVEGDYARRIERLQERAGKMDTDVYRRAQQRRSKQAQYESEMAELIGDTSTWKDKKLGISYWINTLRRNLRDVVRDKKGNRDIAKADAIYEELQGKYNHNEAELKRESTKIKEAYAALQITKAEDAYIQMLGELRHNPSTELSMEIVEEFYEKHKKHIDKEKVDKVIEMARKTYDELLVRLNKRLREQGMKEIPYRKGYFPHFTEDKQGPLGKIFNWKTKNDDIPTDIAGLTEAYNPERSWQSFNKERTSDTTTYSFLQGMDNYVQGALDWIYHIEDIQKRRALENHIRYVHSEEGVKARIDEIRANEAYDADEAQQLIDAVLAEAKNPLGNFVQDLRTGTNILAGKKNSLDRGMESATNRKIYSVMTNLSNRVSANQVAGSISSAFTNFIPITQSWGEVSPIYSANGMMQAMANAVRDDGVIDKSDFLTNRLRNPENLKKGIWDKISDKVGWLMEGVDSLTSQTVWRSKYMQNIAEGMSEAEAIKDADQFAENVLAGRSRGNMPTAFNAKNPLAKVATAFQLEVANQYGYILKDMPQDMKKKATARLVGGYATMFFGAYVYNALFSAMTGRDAALDPIGIIEQLIRGLSDEEEEPEDAVLDFFENVLQEVPFIGGLLGGGRVPLSSAMPYDSIQGAVEGLTKDVASGDWKSILEELTNPLYYLVSPMGGGQIRKTVQGLGMYFNETPGSYTADGGLRYTVETDPLSVLQNVLFGRWSGKEAQQYLDEGRRPLTEKQTSEFFESGMTIQQYWDYRDELGKLKKQDEKLALINGLDLSDEQKRVLKSYLFDEEGYAEDNPEKYAFLEEEGIGYLGWKELPEDAQQAWNWAFENPDKAVMVDVFTNGVTEYRKYTKAMSELKADKDQSGETVAGSRKQKVTNYINGLDLDYGEKIILYKMEYPGEHEYDWDIVEYLNSRRDLSEEQIVKILEQLGAKVKEDGTVKWK